MSTVAAVPAKKRISIGDLLMSIIPLFIMLLLNTAATMPALIIGFIEHMNDEDFDASNYMSWLNSGKASLALTIGFIVYAVTAIIIFGLWYKKSFLKNQIKISNKEAFNPKAVALTLVGTIGVWCIIILSLTLVESLFPSALDNYNEIMESSGFGTNEIITVFYVCLLGPIAEEFMFRAVTQGYFRRSGVPVAAAIFGQAVLFGIAHMNIVQSTYAVFIGAFIGLLRYKYGTQSIQCWC